jgi:uncharacterized membrane protein YphA (DoxX/SURF4 family)
MYQSLLSVLQVLIAVSIFFVWVIRYENVIKEFKQFNLPSWLRDLVGILKLTCAALLTIGVFQKEFAVFGAVGLVALMACAVFTHVRVKNPLYKMVPSVTLFALCALIAFTYAQNPSFVAALNSR